MKQAFLDFLVVTLLSLFCLILYFNSLWGIFIFDDAHSIVNNLYIKDVSYIPLFFKGYFTSEVEIPKGMFRPLLLLTFSFNYFFSGLQPLGYHIINVLLHFVNGVLLYSFLRLLKPDLPFGLALLCGLLFLAHPINTEAVEYISSRSDLMIFLFIFIGSICYLKRRLALAFFSYLLGLLSKETALVFPFLIALFDFLKPPLQANSAEDKQVYRTRNKYFFYFAVAAVSILYWLYRQYLFGENARIAFPLQNPVRSLYSNILTQSAVALFYLRLFAWPNPLTMHHNFPILNSLSEPLAFFSIIILITAVIFIFLLRKKYPLLSFGLAWYLICLLPKFYAPLHVVAAEHHFYLPSFGIYLILAATLKELYVKFKRKFYIVAIGVICLFSILVWFRNYEFKDALTFWRKSVKDDPSSPISHHNLGMAYTQIGLYSEAEIELKKSLSLAPAYANRVVKMVNENLANVYRLQKEWYTALEEINKNIKAGIQDFGTYQSLGVIYLDMNDEKKAQEAWETGLMLNPQSPGILYNLGLLSLRRSEFAAAEQYFQKAIEFDPEFYAAYFNWGKCLEKEGKIDAAIKAYKKTLSLEPKFVDAHYRLGTLYAKRTDLRALDEFKETVRLLPNFAEAHNNLAVLYASIDPPQMELAREHAKKALSLGYDVNKNFLEVIGLEENKEDEKE